MQSAQKLLHALTRRPFIFIQQESSAKRHVNARTINPQQQGPRVYLVKLLKRCSILRDPQCGELIVDTIR